MPRILRTASAVTAAAVITALTATGANAAGESTDQDHRPAIEVLEDLEVAEDGHMDGYDRPERFGGEWTDFDGTGCTTREDILIRDLDPETISVDGDCGVEYGEATDPYTGQNMEHVLGDTDVDIEHVVAAGNAWRSGADEWDDETRREFYQDKDNLVAVSSAANQAKGDDDVAQPNGLPENQALYCDFVGTQAFVKDKWGLAVNPAEHAAMERILSTGDCEDTLAAPAESLMHGEQSEPTSEATADEEAENTAPAQVDPYADGPENTIDENLGMWGIILVAGLLVVGFVARGVFRLRSARRR